MPFVAIGKNDKQIKLFYRIFEKGTGNEIETLNPNTPTFIILHGGFGIVDYQLESCPQ